MQNPTHQNLPLLQRPGAARKALIVCGLLLSHTAVGLAAYQFGGEAMRNAMLERLDEVGQQLQQNLDEIAPPSPSNSQPAPDDRTPGSYAPQNHVSSSPADLDTRKQSAPEFADGLPHTDGQPEGEPQLCWQGEPCESAIVSGVYYVHTAANGGPARWPLPEPDGCTASSGYVCTDEATGFHWSYWKGMYSWYNPEAEAQGLEPYSTQAHDDSAGLAQ